MGTQYNFYLTEDYSSFYIIVENVNVSCAAILDYAINPADCAEIINEFLWGITVPYEAEDGIVWHDTKEECLPFCVERFGFRPIIIGGDGNAKIFMV